MEKIYLRIEYYKDDECVWIEVCHATMDKHYIYFDKYKVKKADTSTIPDTDKERIVLGGENRLIKVDAYIRKSDKRFIPV